LKTLNWAPEKNFSNAFNKAPETNLTRYIILTHATSTLLMKEESPAGVQTAHITTFQEKVYPAGRIGLGTVRCNCEVFPNWIVPLTS